MLRKRKSISATQTIKQVNNVLFFIDVCTHACMHFHVHMILDRLQMRLQLKLGSSVYVSLMAKVKIIKAILPKCICHKSYAPWPLGPKFPNLIIITLYSGYLNSSSLSDK